MTLEEVTMMVNIGSGLDKNLTVTKAFLNLKCPFDIYPNLINFVNGEDLDKLAKSA
jgi:hypothetical protein